MQDMALAQVLLLTSVMRWTFTVLAWIIATAVIVPIGFVLAIVLAGPHSSLLPSVLQPVVAVLCWALVLVGPVLVARAVWHRAGQRTRRVAGSSETSDGQAANS
jgi:hypothetical protein